MTDKKYNRLKEILEENEELKTKVGLSIDCEKAQKNGNLCLGYGGDEDEPCEQCKNCIKCETGYYQLGETEKDENAELKEINTHTLSQLNLDNGELIIENEKLKKENAELKEQNRNYEQLIDKGSVTLVKERLKNYKQLTKAKALLTRFVMASVYFNGKETDLVEEAEQFLKEVEK